MRVLHLAKWYPNAKNPQLGIFIRKHALAAAQHHFIVVIHVCDGNNGELTVNKVHEQFIEISAGYSRNQGIMSKPLNLLNQYRAWEKAIRYARNHYGPFNGLHAHVLLRPALWAYTLNQRYNLPYVISEHWAGYASGEMNRKPYLWKLLARKVTRHTLQILPVSGFLQKNMLKQGLIGKYTVVPNVVDIPEQLPEKPEITCNGVNIVVVSDLVDKIKNISGIVDAFAEIAGQKSEVFLHIGGDGPDAGTLKTRAGKTGLLNKRIFFYGMLTNPEANKLISQASFVIVNSRIETFSVVTGEALQYGKPVIATRCGGPEDIVLSGCGMLINPDDHQALVNAMKTMVEQYNRYDPEKLMHSVNQRFSARSIGKQLDEVYSKCFK